MTGRGRRSAAARWRASTVRSGWVRPSSAARSRQRLSTGTTWMRSQSSRTARRRAVALGDAVVGDAVDEHQRLGEGERRGAPVVVGGHRVERRRPAPARRGSGPAARWCRGRASSRPGPRASSRSRRVPAHGDLARRARAGRRGGPARRSPRATRSSSVGSPSTGSSGPSWATGRPPTVTTIRSPASARRTSAADRAAQLADPDLLHRPSVHMWTHSDVQASGRRATISAPHRPHQRPGGRSELRLQRGAGRAPQGRPPVPRLQVARGRGPRADGDRARATTPPSGRRWATSWACRA